MKSINIMTNCDEIKQYVGKYDIVCMHHVLEHISEPNLFLKQAGKLLKPNGIIYLEVPNKDYFLNLECRELNDFNYTRKHLSYFSADTLKQLLTQNDFTDIAIHGYQFYSVENAINWMRNGRPVKTHNQLDLPNCLEFVDKYYKQYLEERLICDCLVAVGVKG